MVGRYRRFAGQDYKLSAFYKTKRQAVSERRRYGGRVVVLPKGNPYYKQGYRYGVYVRT